MHMNNIKLVAFQALLLATLGQQSSANLTAFNEPCLGVVSDQFSVDRDDLLCETPSGMLYNVSSVGDAWVEKHMLSGELFSGEVILQIPENTYLNTETETLEMVEPPILLQNDPDGRRLRQLAKTTGDKTVLAVRVLVTNSETTHSAGEISEAIFGGPNDFVNLKSQVQACSHGKLNFQKRPDLNGIDTDIRDGVVTIRVNLPVNAGHKRIVNAISREIYRQFGIPHVQIADHVMYCLPENAFGGVGYAIMNRGLSVYNDNMCTSVSTQMHEIGHNLNLGHSSEGSEEYGDQSGMMGYSYRSNEAPKMCYNAAKSYQLGWFRDKSSSYTPNEPGWVDDRTFNIASIVDYDTTNFDVTVEIQQPSTESNYYISFNAAKEFNSGVREGKNKVLVFQKAWIDGNDSWRVADLSAGESFTVTDFNGVPGDKLTITAVSINYGTSEAVVRVRLERAIVPTPLPSRRPTPSPTLYPTSAPTSLPTSVPTTGPTSVPTSGPTDTPTNTPTITPTVAPTNFPTRSPTDTPTNPPTSSPTSGPTRFPTPPPNNAVTGRNPTVDDVIATTAQVSCSDNQQECTDNSECCSGLICQKVSDGTILAGFISVCRPIATESKDRLPRGKRRLRGDTAGRWVGPEASE